MLQITEDKGSTKKVHRMLVCDSHSHMGKDVDGAEMMNPFQAGTGTFDFWNKVESMLKNEWAEGKADQSFDTTLNGKRVKLHIDFVQNPVITNLFQALQKRNHSGQYAEFADRIKAQKLIDFGVCFPFQDEYRKKKPEAEYRASNTNIHQQTSRFPVSMRMIGYMRVNPMEGQRAVDEVEHWASKPNTNIRGLKLHPRSEQWIDSIRSQEAVNVMMKAVEYGLPIIFDTRGKQSILDIADLIAMCRSQIQSTAPHLLPKYKVIIAHAGQGNVDDHEVYRAITQPNTSMDLSMLHGKGAENFLSSFISWTSQNGIEQLRGRKWSEFCLFASDYPYFGEQHAKGLIKFLFNQTFFENGGTIEDCANILGLNQIRLLPEYTGGYKFTSHYPKASCAMLQNTNLLPPNVERKPATPLSSTELMYDTLAALIDDKIIDIHNVQWLFNEDYHNWNQEFVLTTSSPQKKGRVAPLLFKKLQEDDVAIMGLLPNGMEFKPLGYNYFDFDTRQMFHFMFNYSTPVAVPAEGTKLLRDAYR